MFHRCCVTMPTPLPPYTYTEFLGVQIGNCPNCKGLIKWFVTGEEHVIQFDFKHSLRDWLMFSCHYY